MLVFTAFLLLMQAQMPAVDGTPATLAALRYIDLRVGTGAPALPGQKYTVHYTGWLTNGTQFDSSLDRHEPLTFVQGRRQVITGWDIGFEGMKMGGKRRLFIPYQLAYGEEGRGPIPAKAELIFDIELLEVSAAPDLAPAVDVLIPFRDLEKRVIDLAQSMPEEKYPACGAALIRIADLAASKDGSAKSDGGAKADGSAKADASAKGKNETVKLLTASLDQVRKELENARAGFLAADAEVMNQPSNKRGWYAALDAAIAEQLGRASACAGVSGRAF